MKKVAVIAPAFSVDCIETLEEIAITGREQFEHAGGERFAYIPCLNDSDVGMEMIEALVRKELAGGLSPPRVRRAHHEVLRTFSTSW